MIRAYDKKYLNDAMLNPGEAFDFAANVCQVELDDFLSMMISTGIAFPFTIATFLGFIGCSLEYTTFKLFISLLLNSFLIILANGHTDVLYISAS